MKTSEAPIVVEQFFKTTVYQVWDAITVLDQMQQWYFDSIESFKPRVGFQTRFVIENEGRVFPHLWKVTQVIPHKKIVYEWQFEGYKGRSESSFELTEEENGTQLRLTATILEDFPDDIPEFKRESGLQGWKYFIEQRLTAYLKNV